MDGVPYVDCLVLIAVRTSTSGPEIKLIDNYWHYNVNKYKSLT